MASILSWNGSTNTQINNQMPQRQEIDGFVSQIMNTPNPQQTFSQIVSSSPDAQNVMNLIRQYGNGDPKTAFMNYAAAQGKQALAQQIMQSWGLN